MDALIRKQKQGWNTISQFIENTRKQSTLNRSAGYYRGRLDGIVELWNSYRERHDEIMSGVTEEDFKKKYFTDKVFDTNEEKFYDYRGEINDLYFKYKAIDSDIGKDVNQSCTLSPPPTNVNSSMHSALPPIQLVKFSGDYRTWISFHDLFVSIIDSNPLLSDVQKLHYLKTHLSGEAELLLRPFSITMANYQPCWSLLCKRYKNKRVLVSAHLTALTEQPSMTVESAQSIKGLLDNTVECLESLKALVIDISKWDDLLIHLLVRKLPPETHQKWESHSSSSTELPTFSQFIDFLEARFRVLEAVNPSKPKQNKKVSNESMPRVNKHSYSYHMVKGNNCPLCNNSHNLRTCPDFLQLDAKARSEFIRKISLCFNCLAHSHMVKDCKSKDNCRKCNKRHHTLLHKEYPEQLNPSTPLVNSTEITGRLRDNPSSSHIVTLCSQYVSSEKSVLLATALINVSSGDGTFTTFRALVDPGSQATLITENATQRLRLRRTPIHTTITGVAKTETAQSREMVDVCVQSRVYPSFIIRTQAVVLKTLTDLLPNQRFSMPPWLQTQNIPLADPFWAVPGKIDVILGADVYTHIIMGGLMKPPDGEMIAQETQLGWILTGMVPHPREVKVSSTQMFSFYNCVDLQEQVAKFWELEEIPSKKILSPQEIECEDFFQRTYRRQPDGRYIVRLPFLTPEHHPPLLGSSRHIAIKRLQAMERRWAHDATFQEKYAEVLNEYLEFNHMEECEKLDESPSDPRGLIQGCYIPHHAVIKDDSSTTKLRVVFDASSRTSNGQSLNECLMIGPPLQQDIMSLLLRWRKHKIVFTADIRQMYRQIIVNKQDAEYQRIVWKNSADAQIRDYRLLTVTFGVASAPYLAIRVLRQLARDDGKHFPLAQAILLDDIYIDDILTGGDNLSEVQAAQTQVISLLKSGKLELRKWAANSSSLLKDIPIEHRNQGPTCCMNSESTIKALGIYWNSNSDEFIFKIGGNLMNEPYTKRNILSFIAKLFDPLGWISPVVITAKLFMQKLWLSKKSWDEELCPSMTIEWRNYLMEMSSVSEIIVPRWLGYSPSRSIEIHGFCDASEKAYAAVVYVRVIDNTKNIVINLLASKTRVAPIKTISLPRLELCGAELLANLLQSIQQALKLDNASIYAWTDSTIVLAWLQGGAHKWNTFVANRVSRILEVQAAEKWFHVVSSDNPADLATRGIPLTSIPSLSLWWCGPTWLRQSEDVWKLQREAVIPSTDLEMKRIQVFISIKETNAFFILFKHCSTLNKLLRITAYCIRFIKLCRSSDKTILRGCLRPAEFSDARKQWSKWVQVVEFKDELHDLQKEGTVSSSSKLRSLNPFLDSLGLIRVSGRLTYSKSISPEKKHPIILPEKHKFTELLILHSHDVTLHGGVQITLNFLREKFWIVKARHAIKHVISQCVTCCRLRKEMQTQLMGTLPSCRVSISRPFSNVGIDYAGPINIRASKGRGIRTFKGYIVIFVCMSSKAIHLEAAGDLTTATFIAAFRRFIARRGLCRHVYSDCGTNFIGAQAELDEEFHKAERQWSQEAARLFAFDGIEWHFIPPASPHFGGLWEAGVKSVKFHLRRILGNSNVCFEEMITLLAQIEACLNSRPLCPLTDDPDELNALTPGHFLIGTPLLSPPESLDVNKHNGRLNRWQLCQKLKQDFWQQWSQEYLSRLQQRPKWVNQTRNLRIGDLVLVKDERLPALKWMMGRVIDTHPGQDGIIRVVTLRTQSSILKRPISKLCLLPVESCQPTTISLDSERPLKL